MRKWALAKFGGPTAVQLMFTTQDIEKIAELAFYMVTPDDKLKHFPGAKGDPTKGVEDESGFDQFLDKIQTVKDQLALQTAMLKAIGIGEPQLEEIKKVVESKSGTEAAAEAATKTEALGPT